MKFQSSSTSAKSRQRTSRVGREAYQGVARAALAAGGPCFSSCCVCLFCAALQKPLGLRAAGRRGAGEAVVVAGILQQARHRQPGVEAVGLSEHPQRSLLEPMKTLRMLLIAPEGPGGRQPSEHALCTSLAGCPVRPAGTGPSPGPSARPRSSELCGGRAECSREDSPGLTAPRALCRRLTP